MATENLRRSQRAMQVIEKISTHMESNLISQQCFANRDNEDMSPWGLFFAYQICAVGLGSGKMSLKPKSVKNLKDTIIKIDIRWNAAGIVKQASLIIHKYMLTHLGAYLQLLEARTAINKLF
jgi:hypothetical protein